MTNYANGAFSSVVFLTTVQAVAYSAHCDRMDRIGRGYDVVRATVARRILKGEARAI